VTLTNTHRHEELKVKAQAVREELHTEIEKILNDVIHFKIHIQKKLEDYELFVEEEVSHEIRALEGKEETEQMNEGPTNMDDDVKGEYGFGDEVEMRD
jgi:kinetochore protein NDC80